jgi:hypothetical protein
MKSGLVTVCPGTGESTVMSGWGVGLCVVSDVGTHPATNIMARIGINFFIVVFGKENN